MNPYEQRQDARRARLERAAEHAHAESDAALSRARESVAGIPFGQPILVGHHSERRHRAALRRHDAAMGRAVDASKRARQLEERAAAVGTGGISSDDPDAIAKLRAQLLQAEQLHERMKQINAQYRRGGWEAIEGLTPEERARHEQTMRLCPWEKSPIPSYALTNNGANIRRIQGRIAELEAAAARPAAPPQTFAGFQLIDDVDDNRIVFRFDARTPKAVYQLLRSHAFLWSPSRGAFVRKATGNARATADYIAPKIAAMLTEAKP